MSTATNKSTESKSTVTCVTFGEAAKRIGVRYQQVYQRHQQGRLEGAKQVKLSNGDVTYVVPLTTVQAWIDARKNGSKGKRGYSGTIEVEE